MKTRDHDPLKFARMVMFDFLAALIPTQRVQIRPNDISITHFYMARVCTDSRDTDLAKLYQ